MANNNPSFEFDDELLSAYLDDELAPAERARVEERLAADPESRQLLEQLRSVSRSVKELPQQALSADLRDEVLRRAERAKLASMAGDSTSAISLVSPAEPSMFSIGRSRRGWVWAGLTVAAAVLVMVFQSEPNQNKDLPREVAARSSEPAPRPVAAVPELHAAPEQPLAARPAEIATSSAAAPPSEGVPSSAAGSSSAGFAVQSVPGEGGETHPASSAVTTARDSIGEPHGPAPDSSDRLSALRRGGAGGAFGGRADVPSAEPDSQYADLMVVNVSMHPAANKAQIFNRFLASNQILVESPASGPATDDSAVAAATVDRAPAEATAGTRLSASGESVAAAEQEQDVDLYLVEATVTKIDSFLAELNADHANYRAIEVDRVPPAAKQTAAKLTNEVNLERYSRGIVTPQQKVQLAPDNNLYYQTPRGQVSIGRGYVTDEHLNPQRSLGEDQPDLRNQGRAIRLTPQLDAVDAFRGGQLADGQAARDSVAKSRNEMKSAIAPRAAGQSYQEGDKTLQVLFVLSAEAEPAQPPNADAKPSE